MYDPHQPSAYLNTAYEALKGNPQGTQQVLAKASQGAPIGLEGLAAMMAKQSQQASQPPSQPKPSILQQMAGMPGIMGQLPSNIQLGQAPAGPPQAPPGPPMAAGGLVSFDQGGMVLPPDVIEAMQSFFDGGAVHGYAKGGIMDVPDYGAFEPLPGADMSGMMPDSVAHTRGPRVGRGGIPAADIKDPITRVAATHGRGAYVPPSTDKPAQEDSTELEKAKSVIHDTDPHILPKAPKTPKVKPHPEAKAAGYTPPTDNVPQGGTEVHPDLTPASATAPAPAGLAALGGMDLEQTRDRLADLYGHKVLDPETSNAIKALQDKASGNTTFESILGALGKALQNPWGGRFAAGDAAMGMLGAHQQAQRQEMGLDENAFNLLQGYRDAPLLEQNRAADKLIGQLSKSGELESAERIGAMRSMSGSSLTPEMRMMLEDRKDARTRMMIEGRPDPNDPNAQTIVNAQAKAIELAEKWADDQAKLPTRRWERPGADEIENKRKEILQAILQNTPLAQQGQAGYSNLGTGPLYHVSTDGTVKPYGQ